MGCHFQPLDRTWVSRIGGRHFNLWATREAKAPVNSQVFSFPVHISFWRVVWGGLGPRVTCSHGSVMLHLLGHQCPSVLLPGDGETYDACQTVLIITCDHIFLSFCPFVYQFSAFFLSWFQILSRISGFPLDNSILFSGIGKKNKTKNRCRPTNFWYMLCFLSPPWIHMWLWNSAPTSGLLGYTLAPFLSSSYLVSTSSLSGKSTSLVHHLWPIFYVLSTLLI